MFRTGTISCNSSLYTNKEILKGYNNWVKYIINRIGWSIDEKDYEIFWLLIFTSRNIEMLPQKKCQKKRDYPTKKQEKNRGLSSEKCTLIKILTEIRSACRLWHKFLFFYCGTWKYTANDFFLKYQIARVLLKI
jgi:hypothetical protein